MKISPPKYAKQLMLLLFILIVIANHIWGYLGHFGFDDLHYAELANNLRNGIFPPDDHYSYRLTLIGLTSISYSLFGINDFASAIPALISSITILLVVFQVLRKESLTVLFMGLSLTALTYWNLFYADKLMPDVFVALFSLLAIYFIYANKFRNQPRTAFIMAFGAALSLFLGFNSKGTILLVSPLIGYYFICDLFFKKERKFWIYFSSISAVLALIYFAFFEIAFGNGMIRFQSIVQNSYLNLCSYDQQPFIFTLKRISYGLIDLFISHTLIVPFIFIFATGKTIFKKETLLFKTRTAFWTVSSLVLLVSANFMSISLSTYSPMCLDPRHYLFITPIASVATAFLFVQYKNHPKFSLNLLIVSVALFVFALLRNYDSCWSLYFPLMITFAVFFFTQKKKETSSILAILLFTSLLLIPIKMALYVRKVDFRKQEQLFKSQVLTMKDSAVIITDQVQKNLAAYLSGFSKTSPLKICSYEEFDPSTITNDKPIYLFKNWYTSYLCKINESQLPYYLRATADYTKVFEDTVLNIQLYKIDKIPETTTIFHSVQTFENDTIPNWSSFQKASKGIYSGSFASLVGKYSATLRIPLDSLLQQTSNKLIVSSSFQLKMMEDANPSFVISIEKDGQSSFWKGLSIKSQIKSYGNWNPVIINEIITPAETPLGSTLVIYLLNKEEKEMYLDDFKIELLTTE